MKWLCVAGVLLSGCATISRTETVSDKSISSLEKRGTEPDSLTYSIKPEVDGERLTVAVEQAETCYLITTPRKQRTKHVVREADTKFLTSAWTFAGVFALLGTLFYADAQGIADRSNMDNPDAEPTMPDEVRRVGVVTIAIGGVAAGVAIGNHVRAIDSDDDGGIFKDEAERDEFTCNEGPTAREPVTLVLADGTELTGTTDPNGHVAFALTEIPLAAIPRGSGTSSLFPNAGGSAKLVVGGTRLALELADEDADEIASTLMVNPASRVSKEILAKRQSDCNGDVDRARATDIASPEAVIDRWTAAKRNCGDLWTAKLEDELADTRRRVAAARCTAALDRASKALTNDAGRAEIEAADADLKIATKTCDDPNARLRALTSRVARATKQLEETERKARRQAELQRHIVSVERALRTGNPEEAWELLFLEPDLETVVTEQLKNVAWNSLDTALEDVLAARPTRAAAETQMCFVRKVFVAVVGQQELRKAVQRFVGEVGTSDPTRASKVVSALKAGRCTDKPQRKQTGPVTTPDASPAEAVGTIDDGVALAKADPYVGRLRADLEWVAPASSSGESQVGCIRLNADGSILDIDVKSSPDSTRNDLREPVWNALKRLQKQRSSGDQPVPKHLMEITKKWVCFRFSGSEDDGSTPRATSTPQNVPPTLLEGSRTAGDKNITPDDVTKTEIARSGRDRIIGSFKLCVGTRGDVASVTLLKSTGFPAYDQKILSTMQDEWKYRPYMVNGNVTPVCTAVTFIYSQK
jgi:hypothetical protein